MWLTSMCTGAAAGGSGQGHWGGDPHHGPIADPRNLQRQRGPCRGHAHGQQVCCTARSWKSGPASVSCVADALHLQPVTGSCGLPAHLECSLAFSLSRQMQPAWPARTLLRLACTESICCHGEEKPGWHAGMIPAWLLLSWPSTWRRLPRTQARPHVAGVPHACSALARARQQIRL